MEPADFYSGIVVDAYAQLRSSTFHAAPYIDFVRAYGEPGLEIGCGAGEPMLDLCASGLDVDGVDSSLDMVTRCLQHAGRRGLSVDVFHQRVEDLDLGRRYGAIYFAGPTFKPARRRPDSPAGTRQDRRAPHRGGGSTHPALGARAHRPRPPGRRPGGSFPPGGQRAADPVRLRYTPISESYDPVRRTRVTACRYERLTDRETEVADREWVIHWQTTATMSDLCDQAGLEVMSMIDDDTHEAATSTSEGFTATVRRRSA